MARIAIGGWQHETNTFATIKADYAAFELANEWPPLARGDAMLDAVQGVHLPINGAADHLNQFNHKLVPLLWCSASPSSYVTEDAFERIMAMLLEEIQSALPLDGIYLDLHGAMVCEHLQDGEGEILQRIRTLIGDTIPIAVSLDLHANVTQKMVNHASVIDIFRTYPHIDMGETGARTAGHLLDLIKRGKPYYKAFRQTDFLIPLNWGCTVIEPGQSLYAHLPTLIKPQVTALSFACGFHLSDIHDVGPSMVAYGTDQAQVDEAADTMLAAIQAREADFSGKIWPTEQGVKEALRLLKLTNDKGQGPVILADTQDNPGGGGPGDTTGLLKTMLELEVQNAVLGIISDPIAAKAAHKVGIGGVLTAQLGERAGLAGHRPLAIEAKVLNLSDGRFTATGPMYHGARVEIGPCALLQINGVQVVVSSRAVQVADQQMFKHIGVDPSEKAIVALKSSVHFRNDFSDMAHTILVVAAPGPVYADPEALDFKHIRPGVRRSPHKA